MVKAPGAKESTATSAHKVKVNVQHESADNHHACMYVSAL